MEIKISKLKVEYRERPQGVGTGSPRLSWVLTSNKASKQQRAYQVQVCTNREAMLQGTVDMWDSGVVESDQSQHVVYEGRTLQSGQIYYWRVQVWDESGSASGWSELSCWTMGLLSNEQWRGQWIGRIVAEEEEYPSPSYIRKAFKIERPVRRATVFATALGLYELNINGNKVGADRFAPGWTDYAIRTQYQTYDVTGLLQVGGNAMGLILGTGWYAGHVGMMGAKRYGTSPQCLVQCHIEYVDGSSAYIVSDSSWRLSAGPILYSDILRGECYDARREWGGWDEAGFDDADWSPAVQFERYAGCLDAQIDPPIQVMQSIKPIAIRRTDRGTYVADLGQNIAGWVRLKIKAAAGTQITLQHAEMLNSDGSLYLDNLRKAQQQDIYIARGGSDEEIFEPRFTYHGFRYVEIEGLADEPGPDFLLGQAAYSATPHAGSFETNDSMINQLYSNITWGQKGNFFSVPTDCPQRDERLGWTGDAQIFIRTASYNMDVASFFTKYMVDMIDAQKPSGAFPDTAPDAGWYEWKQAAKIKWMAPDNAGWGDAGIIIPWTLYLVYGDTRILEQHYEAMKRWVNYLQANSTDLLRPGYANHADWLSINADTPFDVLATQYFGYSTALFGRIAAILGRSDDEAHYNALFEQIKHAFIGRYVDQDGRIEGDTQTVYALALAFNLLTDELKPKAIERLAELIRINDNHLSTGFLGVGYLLPVLTECGESELAYTLLHQESFPSWLYSVKHGATTIWERWDGWTDHKGFQTPSMNSFNHYSLGSVGEWMFRHVAGIDADPQHPGFKHFYIRPVPGGKLKDVKCTYECGYGTIASCWQLNERNEFTLQVEVPVNTTATVVLPDGQQQQVRSGKHEFACSLVRK